MSKHRDEVVKMIAKAMHEEEDTRPYGERGKPSRQNLEAQAEAALTALERAGLIDEIY